MESVYYRGLEAPAKRRYREKLSFVGLSIKDDPFLEGNKPRFNDNMATWNYDTFCRKVNEYLYNTCSVKFALNLQIEPSRIVDIHFSKPKRGTRMHG